MGILFFPRHFTGMPRFHNAPPLFLPSAMRVGVDSGYVSLPLLKRACGEGNLAFDFAGNGKHRPFFDRPATAESVQGQTAPFIPLPC